MDNPKLWGWTADLSLGKASHLLGQGESVVHCRTACNALAQVAVRRVCFRGLPVGKCLRKD